MEEPEAEESGVKLRDVLVASILAVLFVGCIAGFEYALYATRTAVFQPSPLSWEHIIHRPFRDYWLGALLVSMVMFTVCNAVWRSYRGEGIT